MDFLDKISKKSSKTEKVKITTKFYIFKIVLGNKFQLKLTILNFWTKLTQKGYFLFKRVKNENHHQILHIGISKGSSFQLQQTVLIFWNKFSKQMLLPVRNRK